MNTAAPTTQEVASAASWLREHLSKTLGGTRDFHLDQHTFYFTARGWDVAHATRGLLGRDTWHAVLVNHANATRTEPRLSLVSSPLSPAS
ncbi:hypothetical protein [Deinococcus yavapaiensis]|uniref:Uncharacterized protein n=1 Tax=Deinococcus yavapaiensis KR-236 TaxID=694435 RepID=A0A318S6Z0_9DEIO|nr:hypothetical protein [Deinococcus yavapaiensis]PYE50950.1 hypothetical protein DES52_11617 [Deinococcus yavapaiensis KR-236]